MRALCLSLLLTAIASPVLYGADAPLPQTPSQAPSQAAPAIKPLPEIVLGSEDAPITLIEYSSLSCGHCAVFHEKTLPKIKEKYIDKGLVKIYFRSYPSDGPSLRATQLAWCGGELRYMDLLGHLFKNQDKWLFAKDPVESLKKVALEHGVTRTQFEGCINDEELMNRILLLREEGHKKYQIKATPTIVINGKIYVEALTFERFEEIIGPLLNPTPEKVQ